MRRIKHSNNRGDPSKHVVDVDEVQAELWGSFLLFCKVFYPEVSGREFIISKPVNRESHFITIARELTRVARGQEHSLLINVPPGHGKSTLLSLWVAWTMSRWPDSQFLYISYSHQLAAKHTAFIKRIIESPQYRWLFDIQVREDSRAKDFFQTKQGGAVKAFGSGGSIVGQDAGLPGLDRFSGAVIIDDMHKIDEAHSDVIRERVITNYRETILQRPRGPNVPIVSIGQRVHEADVSAFMLSGEDERTWRPVILKALDENGNALYPETNPKEALLKKKEKNSYVFSAQFQQDPAPAGGGLFRRENFMLFDKDPHILSTFITADTAETSRNYNDATVFSFWGIYEVRDFNKTPKAIQFNGMEEKIYALHWIDCVEIRVEPKDLQEEFLNFYAQCMLYKVKPSFAAIEKKSTGTTLVSVLKDMQGISIKEIGRAGAKNNKITRFREIQPYIDTKLVTFTAGRKHVSMCIDHMVKITGNDAHRFDDICDTCADAVKLALIDKKVSVEKDSHTGDVSAIMSHDLSQKLSSINKANGYGNGRIF